MRRPSPPRPIPPPLELECLKSLWRLGEANVKQVQDELAPSKGLAYTTVMTLLDRLVRKGCATRRKQGRFYVYSPVLEADRVRNMAVKELADTLFGGSREALLAFLQGQGGETQLPGPESDEEKLDTALL